MRLRSLLVALAAVPAAPACTDAEMCSSGPVAGASTAYHICYDSGYATEYGNELDSTCPGSMERARNMRV